VEEHHYEVAHQVRQEQHHVMPLSHVRSELVAEGAGACPAVKFPPGHHEKDGHHEQRRCEQGTDPGQDREQHQLSVLTEDVPRLLCKTPTALHSLEHRHYLPVWKSDRCRALDTRPQHPYSAIRREPEHSSNARPYRLVTPLYASPERPVKTVRPKVPRAAWCGAVIVLLGL